MNKSTDKKNSNDDNNDIKTSTTGEHIMVAAFITAHAFPIVIIIAMSVITLLDEMLAP